MPAIASARLRVVGQGQHQQLLAGWNRPRPYLVAPHVSLLAGHFGDAVLRLGAHDTRLGSSRWDSNRASQIRQRHAATLLTGTLVHALALTPAAILAWQIREEFLTGSGGLGADPVAEIDTAWGLWALRFLMLTLAITPLRQITGQSALLRLAWRVWKRRVIARQRAAG